MEISIIIPCLDEAETIDKVVKDAFIGGLKTGKRFEVIVADNGSTDGSIDIARRAGARVVSISDKGYGAAIIGGVNSANGEIIVMADADDSYELENLNKFTEVIQNGFDLVVGNRFKGGIEKGAMPFLHRYLGNPILSLIGRIFFKIKLGDFHCGMRGFSKSKFKTLNINSSGMEFASEMIAKFALSGSKIAEVPTILRPDGRTRKPHLRTWRDGWRHLRFLLVFSPGWLFYIPGLILLGLGLSLIVIDAFTNIVIFGKEVQVLGTIIASMLIITGVQIIWLESILHSAGNAMGIMLSDTPSKRMDRYALGLEKTLLLTIFIQIVSSLWIISIYLKWRNGELNNFQPENRIKFATLYLMITSVNLISISSSFAVYFFKNSTINIDKATDSIK